MAVLNRYLRNPIIRPDPDHDWEKFATFNGTILKDKDRYYLFYRAMTDEIMYKGRKMHLSSIGISESADGVNFGNRHQYLKPEYSWEQYGCEDPRITKLDGQYFLFYTALSNWPAGYKHIKCAVAVTDNLSSPPKKHLVTPFNAKAMTLFPEKVNGMYTVLLTVNTDNPPSYIAYAQFENIETLWDTNFWLNWYDRREDYTINIKRINSDQVEVGAPPIKTPAGWVLIYSYIKNYFSQDKIFRIESSLLHENDPQKIIGRIEEPCMVPQEYYEFNGQVKNVIFPEGAYIEGENLRVYYGAADSYCCLAVANYRHFMQHFSLNSPEAVKCRKLPNNPLLEPVPEHEWENLAVLNPAAIKLNNKVYLMYRAISENNVSTMGLAISDDGVFIDERLSNPVYKAREAWEISETGDNYGCEDPRLTVIDDVIHMCYTAYDGKIPRLALTSISITDFLNRQWSGWAKPKLISPAGIPDKDGCLFPEKINGKYVFFHRIEPNIIMDFVDDLDFASGQVLKEERIIYPGGKFWDGVKIGVNTTPIKTKYGWLTFYHGISQIDHHYRVGALIFDLADPAKIISRTLYPILEPEQPYETSGIVDNVVFPCGTVQIGDDVMIYYGGADKVVCAARINLDYLLQYMIKSTAKKYLEL